MKDFLISFLLLSLVNSKCIWRGVCNPGAEQIQYSSVEAEPVSLNRTEADLISTVCPQYLVGKNLTCCNGEQISAFSGQLSLAKNIIGGCPACYENFKRLFCAMTCDPDQDKFVKKVKITPNNCVSSLTYFTAKEFKEKVFNSCSNVKNSGIPAVQMICESENCTYIDFFKALGDSSRRAPFDIDFNEEVEPEYKLYNGTLYSCSQKINATPYTPELPACTCQDCHQSCYAPIAPVTPGEYKIFNLNFYWFIMIVTFSASLVIILLVHIICCVKRCLCAGQLEDDRVGLLQESIESLNKRIGWRLKLSAGIEERMGRLFGKIGKYVSTYSYFFIISSIIFVGIFGFGLRFFHVATDPIELWSSKDSRARLEKAFFDENFQPFYRIEQIIIKPGDKYKLKDHGPAWNKDFLNRAIYLQSNLTSLRIQSEGKNFTLRDICFKPLAPDNLNCAITSPLEYFQGNINTFECGGNEKNFYAHLESCTKNPTQIYERHCKTSCFGSSGIPINSNIAFGGYPGNNYTDATSIIITYLVNNDNNPNSEQIKLAKLWEAEYVKYLKAWVRANDDITVSFSSERSIEDELSRQSKSDVLTVLISYLIMFLYVTLTLGSYKTCKRFFVDVKIVLGLCGVAIVMLAVVAAIGLCSYFGIPASLISIEVIPFLVLAIGVDNIYIIVQTFENYQTKRRRRRLFENLEDDDELESGDDFDAISSMTLGAEASNLRTNREYRSAEISHRIAKTMAKVGPSIFLSSLSESCAFFCGTISSMPAVRVFAIYAGIAILINFFLQMTFFLAILSLDALRQASNRFDIFCCFKLKKRKPDDEVFLNSEPNAENDLSKELENRSRPFLVRAVSDYLAPLILHQVARVLILILMIGWVCFCIAVIPTKLEVGLDQKLSMPLDSYVLSYFEALATDLKVGPPVYFVMTDGFDYSKVSDQDMICGSIGCSFKSLNSRLQMSSNYPDITKISGPKFSWIDDYFEWLQADGPKVKCCRVYKNDTKTFCDQKEGREDLCQLCPLGANHRPVDGKDFNFYLPHFLEQPPNIVCPRGGSAAYSHAIKLKDGQVVATNIMTYHTPLQDSKDFISALENARQIADTMNDQIGNNEVATSPLKPRRVFPYSVFYVFYDQYIDMYQQTAIQLGICGSVIFLITFIVLGLNFLATAIVIIGVFQILLSVMTVMALTGITLNAISLVNLVVSIGIGVEFCIHIVHEFTVSLEVTRLHRAHAALASMGSSVLRGITLTKFGGILILAFSKSRLFQIFYFRMYLSLVVSGAVVGLIFVPVLLSFFGPGINIALLVEKRRQEEVHTRQNDFREFNSEAEDNSPIPQAQ